MELLLTAARPFDDGFRPLWPLWAQEATHRALCTLRLFEALSHADHGPTPAAGLHERRLALHLAEQIASLHTLDISRVLACSGPLREIARDLVALFGPAAGTITLHTDIAPVSLPAYKRRALALLGHELLSNALAHAFQGRATGRLSLRLALVSPATMRLDVADDGIGFRHGVPDPVTSIAGALTDLLEGELYYLHHGAPGTRAVATFPLTLRVASALPPTTSHDFTTNNSHPAAHPKYWPRSRRIRSTAHEPWGPAATCTRTASDPTPCGWNR